MKSVMKFALALALAHARANTVIKTSAAPSGPSGAAQGIVDGRGRLTTSMQYGTDPATGKLVPGGASAQMIQAMTNIAKVFAAADLEIAQSGTSCWLYGFNATTFGDISGAYNTFFPDAAHHPARNPTGATLVLEGALVGVSCRGFPQGGKRIAPADFFASDFNAQGLLVDGGAHLFTSAQVGADPVTGDLVSGGAASEARQAMSNLAVVFAAAFPALGAAALAERASECQLMIVNDTGSGAAASVWKAVEDEVATFFNAGSLPAVSITGFPAGSLPIPALVAATCNGVGASANRTSLASGGGIVERVGGTMLLQANPTYGEDVSAAFGATAALFDEAFPNLATAGAPAAALRSAATACELWLADPAADADAALASLSALFVDLPALTVTKAALPTARRTDGPVALQCFGSHTNSLPDAGGAAGVHWSWDMSELVGGTCKKENGNGTIVPGSGGNTGQQVASCKAQGHTLTLHCRVNVTAATSASASGTPTTTTTGSAGALSLQAHFTNSGYPRPPHTTHFDGPVVHSGCSTIDLSVIGQCCFV